MPLQSRIPNFAVLYGVLTLCVLLSGCVLFPRHILYEKVQTPQTLTVQIIASEVKCEQVIAKYVELIAKEFKGSPLLAIQVNDFPLPPHTAKLHRYFAKSQVLSEGVYFEMADYEINVWSTASGVGRDNGVTNALDLHVRARCGLTVSLSSNTQSFHNPSDKQFQDYERAIQKALDRAKTNLLYDLHGQIEPLN